MRLPWPALLAFVAFVALAVPPPPACAAAAGGVGASDLTTGLVRVGVLANEGAAACRARWSATVDHLTAEVPPYRFVLVPLSFDEAHEAAAGDSVDFLLVNPGLYVENEVRSGAVRLATLKSRAGGLASSTFGGVVITRPGRADLTRFEDLRGKRFAAVNPTSFGGWLCAWREFQARGLEPYRDFAALDFLGTQAAVVEAVRRGLADAGTVRTDVLERMAAAGTMQLSEVAVLEPRAGSPKLCSTRLYPEWPFAACRRTPQALVERVAVALIGMRDGCPAARTAGCAGWTVPANYEDVRACLRELRVAPYPGLDALTLGQVLEAYRPWALGAGLALGLLVLALGVVVRLNRRLAQARRAQEAELARRSEVEGELRASEERLKAEAGRAREATAAVEEASRQRGAFVAQLSHELKTPIGGILGMADLLAAAPLEPEAREYVAMIREAAETLQGVVADVLDFSRMEAGRLGLDETSFDLRALLAQTVRGMALRAEDRDVELTLRVAPEVPSVVVGDGPRLRQILVNLLDNALKYTTRGGVELEVGLEPGALAGAVWLRLTVRDSGPGIPSERLQSLFAPYVQVGADKVAERGGAGLGLVIARRLSELMGGSLRAESEVGLGSAFHATLRLRPEPGGAPAAGPTEPAHKGSRALVVEALPRCRALVADVLRRQGLTVVEAQDPDGAWRAAAAAQAGGAPFDLAVVAARVGAKDGFGLVEGLRGAGLLPAPVVVVLGVGQLQREAARGPVAGVVARLVRPLVESDLVAVLDRTLGQGRTADAAAPPQPPPEPEAPQRRLNILVAEDNLVNRRLAIRLLEGWGHQVAGVENGALAVEAVRAGSFDVVLMDLQMPVMDGLAAAAAIRADERSTGRRVAIIALTAHALPMYREKCLAVGMDAYATKPIDPTALRAALDRAVGAMPGLSANPVAAPSSLPPAPAPSIFDRPSALARACDDETLLSELLDLYFQNTLSQLLELRSSLAAGDAAAAREVAHSLKGSSANLGADVLRDVFARAEEAAVGGDLAAVAELAATAERELEVLRRHLGRAPAEPPDGAGGLAALPPVG